MCIIKISSYFACNVIRNSEHLYLCWEKREGEAKAKAKQSLTSRLQASSFKPCLFDYRLV